MRNLEKPKLKRLERPKSKIGEKKDRERISTEKRAIREFIEATLDDYNRRNDLAYSMTAEPDLSPDKKGEMLIEIEELEDKMIAKGREVAQKYEVGEDIFRGYDRPVKVARRFAKFRGQGRRRESAGKKEGLTAVQREIDPVPLGEMPEEEGGGKEE